MATKRRIPRKHSQQKVTRVYTSPIGVDYVISKVSQNTVNMVVPAIPKPEKPFVEMEIAGGGKQKRPIKDGDEGWDEYQEKLAEWEKERSDLIDAVTYVAALGKDLFVDEDEKITLFEANPEDLVFSDTTEMLIQANMIEVPENPWLAKFMWLFDVHLGQHDKVEIQWLLMELNNTPREVINRIKDSFRREVQGEDATELDEGDKPDTA